MRRDASRAPRLAKIVATLGPASESPAVLDALLAAGLDVARLNFSHGTWEWHRRVAARAHAAARRAGRPLALLQDLQGPRIRLGTLDGESRQLADGASVELVPEGARASGRGGAIELPTTWPRLAREVRKGERILLRDGRVGLRVTKIAGGRVRAEVERGGEVRSHSGMNLPDSRLSAPALTAKDRADLARGEALGVDAVALSFVRSARDVTTARELLRRARRETLVIAKIERREAIEELDAILAAADGVMVARGDLGVELPLESIPLLQKELLRRAIRAHAFAITATQMLESMVTSETPTRAEVSDVANAILDGTDAVMLSAETSIGAHPIEAVATLDRVVREVEQGSVFALPAVPPVVAPPHDLLLALAAAAVRLAEQSGARALVPLTASGRTAAIVATWRPGIPILACSPDPAVCRRLLFWRGVHPRRMAARADLEQSFAAAVADLRSAGLLAKGDAVVLIGGRSLARGGSNLLQVLRVGAPVALARRHA